MIDFGPANIKLWSKMGSRAVFGGVAAPELAAENANILFLAADVATSAGLARLQAASPEKVLNTGIAEQNMIGLAAGLASQGFLPFAMSFAPFATMRCADQIRLCMGYMGKNIKVVGLASGLAMGINGPTHLGYEDIAIMRAIPGIALLSPADSTETVKATLAAAAWEGPLYLRLSGGLNNPIVYDSDYNFQIGKAIRLRDGGDVAIIATGTMVAASLKAAELLAGDGIQASVTDMHTIRPLDTDAILNGVGAKLVVTIEEHSASGGLGGAVAEFLSGIGGSPKLLRLGLNSYPAAASYEYLLESCGLTPKQIAESIKMAI